MKANAIIAVSMTLSGIAISSPLRRKELAWATWENSGSPFYFTSTYSVVATPDQVINGTTVTPGEPGAVGYYNYGINADLGVICYVSNESMNYKFL